MIPKLTHVKRTIRNKNIPKQISINFEWFHFLLLGFVFISIILYYRYKEKKNRVKEKNKNFNNFINEVNNFYINN